MKYYFYFLFLPKCILDILSYPCDSGNNSQILDKLLRLLGKILETYCELFLTDAKFFTCIK